MMLSLISQFDRMRTLPVLDGLMFSAAACGPFTGAILALKLAMLMRLMKLLRFWL